MDRALVMAGLWVSTELEGRTASGAFSEAWLGIPAVEYFPLRAYRTLKAPDCKWQWKEGTKLSTLFINVMKSDMAHTLRHYKDNGEPDLRAASQLHWHGSDDTDDEADRNSPLEVAAAVREGGFQVMSEMELLEDLEARENRRTQGYKIARAVAKGDPEMERYVELVFTLPDLRSISKRMKKTQDYVLAIEAELVERVKLKLRVKS